MREKQPVGRYVVVYSTHGEATALVIKAKLESEGIPAQLAGGQLMHLYPTTINGLAEIKILVPEADAERARHILSEIHEAD